MADKFADMKQEEFDSILEEVANEHGYFQVPGVYEALAEHYNNEVLERWAAKHGRCGDCGTYLNDYGQCIQPGCPGEDRVAAGFRSLDEDEEE